MRNWFGLLGIVFLMIGCKQSNSDDLGLGPGLASFETFYEKFHRDSVYQMEHITFPLQGLPGNYKNKTDYSPDFRWTTQNWNLNKPLDLEATHFVRSFIAVSDELIIEKLQFESGEYGMERRFSLMNGEWMLIYYAGINPL